MSEVFPSSASSKASKFEAMDNDMLGSILNNEIKDAVNFLDSELSGIRITADAYYRGQTVLSVEKGRSQVVVSKVRDTIQAILPSVGRVFGTPEDIVEFTSDDEEDEDICTDITAFTNGVFRKSGGFGTVVVATTDALKARVGIVQVDFAPYSVPKSPSSVVSDSASQTSEALEGVAEDQEVEQATSIRGCWEFNGVPPEEFFVNATAVDLKTARVFGRRRNERIYELLSMGLDYDDLVDLAGDDDQQVKNERNQRRQFVHDNDDSNTPSDPLSREVLLTEGFIRVDFDGDGVAELRKFVAVGSKYKVLKNDPVDFHNIAVFKISLQPHVFFPISLAEDSQQDQDSQTALLRSIIDNTALVNQPRTEVNENMVNLEDVKNNEIGAIIRVKQMGQISELVTPFVAGQTLPVLQYLSTVSEERSGVTKMSQGLSADALQSTSRVAANAAVMGGEARMEMMIRNIAETGIRDMFLIILRTAMYVMKNPISIKTDEGKYRMVKPDFWHDHLDINLGVGTGSGRSQDKKEALSALAALQTQTLQTAGLQNPMVSWNNLRNTYKKMLKMSGIHNVGDYLPAVDEKTIQAFAAQQSKSAQEAHQAEIQSKQQDTQAYVQVEIQKVQQKAEAAAMHKEAQTQKMEFNYKQHIMALQAELARAQGRNNTSSQIALMQDDQQRDKNDQNFILGALKIGADLHSADSAIQAPRGNLEERAQ